MPCFRCCAPGMPRFAGHGSVAVHQACLVSVALRQPRNDQPHSVGCCAPRCQPRIDTPIGDYRDFDGALACLVSLLTRVRACVRACARLRARVPVRACACTCPPLRNLEPPPRNLEKERERENARERESERAREREREGGLWPGDTATKAGATPIGILSHPLLGSHPSESWATPPGILSTPSES